MTVECQGNVATIAITFPPMLRLVFAALSTRGARGGRGDWLVDEQRERRAVVALSGNSIGQALLMLGCCLAGVRSSRYPTRMS